MEAASGEILTFYSYKGGTGRSMALANIACLLAQKEGTDQNVLMIDWDLEAPGLHQFFHGRFDDLNGLGGLASGQLGLIDLFYEIKDRLENSKSQDNFLEDIFSDIDIQKYIVKVNHLQLFLMPAGKFDDGLYSNRVNQFDWVTFFNSFPLVITQFAQFLRKKFRYVLIDSRTGYTDISGICTGLMPEKLVTVFTPNRQSLSGIVELIRRAVEYRKQSDDLRPLMIFPLPSRIENAESQLQKIWRFGDPDQGIEGYQTQLESVLEEVYDLQGCDLTQYFDEYQLQYVPRYSYGEELAVLSERPEDRLSLARSFENFSERIIGSGNPWKEVQDSIFEYETDNREDGHYEKRPRGLQKNKPKGMPKNPLRYLLDSKYLSILSFLMALIVLIFGNNIYENMTGRSIFAYPPTQTPSPPVTLTMTPRVTATQAEPTFTLVPATETSIPTLTVVPSVALGQDWAAGCISTLWIPYPPDLPVTERGDGCWKEPVHVFSAENGDLDFLAQGRNEPVEIYGLFAPLPATGTVTLRIRLRELSNVDLWLGVFAEADLSSDGLLMIVPSGNVKSRIFVQKDPFNYETIASTSLISQENGYSISFNFTENSARSLINPGEFFTNSASIPSSQKWLFLGYRGLGGSYRIDGTFTNFTLE
jgi:MinD-like ATPase involved in chromosome partitioning or flagellar assembly